MKRLTEDYKDKHKKQSLNTLALKVLSIYKTKKKTAVAVKSGEDRVFMVTS